MRNGSLEQMSVNAAAARVPEMANALRERHIDPSSRTLLSVAAAACGVETADLLAVAEYRGRRAAREAAHRAREAEAPFEQRMRRAA